MNTKPDTTPPPGIPPRPTPPTPPPNKADRPLGGWLDLSAACRRGEEAAYKEFGDPTLSYLDVADLVYAILHGRYPALRQYAGWCVGGIVRPQDVGILPGADLRGMDLSYALVKHSDVAGADLRGANLWGVSFGVPGSLVVASKDFVFRGVGPLYVAPRTEAP